MDDDPSKGTRGRRRRSNDSPPQQPQQKIIKTEANRGCGDQSKPSTSRRQPIVYEQKRSEPGPAISGSQTGDRPPRRDGPAIPGSQIGDRPPRRDGPAIPGSQIGDRPPRRDGPAIPASQIGDRPPRRDRYEIVQTRSVESKVGKSGKPVNLHANYFSLLTKPTWRINQYHVAFEPEIELRRVRGGVLSEHKSILGGYLFDGAQLFTTTKLTDKNLELQSKSQTGEVYKITIKSVGVISMTEWQSLQVLNLILRRAMEGLQLQLIGRNLFDALAKIEMREYRIQLWPGYITSIRQCEKDILLCTEIAHKVMRTETVYDIMRRCIQERGNFNEVFMREVFGMTVLTDYNNKTYRIDNVDFNKNPTHTFDIKGKKTTFIDYYFEKYNIRIHDPKQPLLISKSKERQVRSGQNDWVILIPELCRATGMTERMKSDFQLTNAMATHTRMDPLRRIERLKSFNRRLHNTEASMKVLKDWNMSLNRELVEVRGRLIEPLNIYFSNNMRASCGQSADWGQQFKGKGMFTSPTRGLERWSVIVPHRNVRDCRNLIQKLIDAANGMKLHTRNAIEHIIIDDRNYSYVQAIEEAARLDPQLIFCFVPNVNAERYNVIKKKTCVERAIPTQVVTNKTATRRGLMSIATKIAIQINCKLGYTPWMIDLPITGLMTIGYDISRSSRDKSKAYGALVASMDMVSNATFFSTVAECHGSDLLSNEITISVCKALRQYQKEHHDLPKKIILYRDGVGEGSLKQLVEHEVQTLVKKLEQIYENESKSLALAYVVVSKQINTRFFERGKNPLPGTVVDDVVTLPEHYDFYLVSQSVRQGTVAPTYYNVVHSNIKLTPDQIQLLTYKMTHLYYNWSGTLRVPAVCQYAKKLATLVSQSIHAIPTNALEKKLYYL